MSLLSSIFSTASTQSTSLFTNSKAASTPTEPAKTDASFGPSYLLDISSEANNAAASASTTSDSDKDKESQDALLALIQQLLTTVQTYLQNIGEANPENPEVASTDTSNSTDSSASALAGLSGPVSNAQVEHFLGEVEAQPNISDDQKKQVHDMMAQYKNVPTTSAMLESIQATLASSGILPIA